MMGDDFLFHELANALAPHFMFFAEDIAFDHSRGPCFSCSSACPIGLVALRRLLDRLARRLPLGVGHAGQIREGSGSREMLAAVDRARLSSEERRVGNEGGSTCRSGGARY